MEWKIEKNTAERNWVSERGILWLNLATVKKNLMIRTKLGKT